MRARLGFLHVVSSQYDYKINLYSKYTIITGFSGRGKSTLVTLVAQALYEKSTSQDLENFVELQSTVAVGIIDESVANYKGLHNYSWFEAISNMFKPKMILLVDEDFSGLHNIEFQKALCDYDALYVIICRDGMNSLPYGVEDIYKITLSTAGNFHFNKPLYNKGDHTPRNFSPYDRLYLEDSGSGFKFFKDFLVFVDTTSVKKNVYNLAQVVQNSVFCVDGLGFGSEFLKVLYI